MHVSAPDHRKLRTVIDLKLKRVAARPASIRGAYELTGGRYTLGGSLYTVTLNAVQSTPKGATLTLTFVAPAQRG